jgi:hypothetical protein
MSDATNNFPPVIESDRGEICDHIVALEGHWTGETVYLATFGVTPRRADAAPMTREEAIERGQKAVETYSIGGFDCSKSAKKTQDFSDFEAVAIQA